MFLLEKDSVFSPDLILKILQKFKSGERPQLQKYYDYYTGQGQEILKKFYSDSTKPCNRIVVNYPLNIVDNFNSYLTGKDITYKSNEDISNIQDVLNYNDVSTEDAEFLRNALIYGYGAEVMWIDEDKKIRFKTVDSRNVIPVYSNTIDQELIAVIRYYAVDTVSDSDEGYYVELYTPDEVITYRSRSGFDSLVELESVRHYFGQVPVNVFYLQDGLSSFDCILTLQDTYNTLLSSEVDDFQAFIDSYLVLKNMVVDEDELSNMRTNRVLLVGDGGEVSYLTKDVNDAQIQNMLNTVADNIARISCCPNFADEAFGTASGIAMKYKLLGFSNRAEQISKSMAKALQRRIELICSILSIVGEETWRDVEIIFNPNLPTDYSDIMNTVNGLRGLVSEKTLLAQIPFVQDIDTELELLQEEKANSLDLYQNAFIKKQEEDELNG